MKVKIRRISEFPETVQHLVMGASEQVPIRIRQPKGFTEWTLGYIGEGSVFENPYRGQPDSEENYKKMFSHLILEDSFKGRKIRQSLKTMGKLIEDNRIKSIDMFCDCDCKPCVHGSVLVRFLKCKGARL